MCKLGRDESISVSPQGLPGTPISNMEYQTVEPGSGWWVMLLGWPAVLGASVAFTLAVARKSRAAAIFGLILAAPMCLYLSATPRFQWPAPLAFAFLCVLTWRIRESGWLTSALLALPAAAILIWLALAISMR
jgi:hypothetical protein